MCKTNQSILVALLFFFMMTPVLAEALTAREIMIRNESARKADISEVAELQMTLINHQGRERVRRVSFILDDTDPLLRKSYLRFIAPQNVEGIAFVQLEHAQADNDRWLYLPSQRRTRRISGNTKTDSFVGTDFSFEDFEILDGQVAGQNRNYQLLREEIRDGVDCWVIEAVPATDEERAISGYGKRVIWIAKSHYHAVYTEFYDHHGELFKVMTADQFAVVAGGDSEEMRPHRLIMETLKTGHRTVIEFRDFVLNEPLDPRMFTREYLSRG
ncbi:outer membrane lipoprotein-sorting protein [Nitrincola alkalilacustris]|uniref:outer membrane lipoprotein-sorting protein n=1 Tax=Nitrincola alkalilacustris TaxID=1571224 RepID=UPI0014565C32|nr:outer membrane lipoprotein-sorting protein [Nitrincola alkalilacustris]